MAAEAVLKIKEAEEKGNEMRAQANERAKEIIKKAESDAALNRKNALSEANRTKAGIIEEAQKKAGGECNALAERGALEKESILNPAKEKVESAVQYAIGRIVSANGNS